MTLPTFEQVSDMVLSAPGVAAGFLHHYEILADKRGHKEGGQDFVMYQERRRQFRVVLYGKLRAPSQFADALHECLGIAVEDAFTRANIGIPEQIKSYIEDARAAFERQKKADAEETLRKAQALRDAPAEQKR